MSDWYHNRLFVIGKPDEVTAIKHKAAGRAPFQEPSPLSFHNFVPLPEDIIFLEECNSERHECEYEYWGCKWGACYAELAVC
jgi:hypothetical protein